MADTIQLVLEDMVPELEEWVKKGLFAKAEVKAIVQKRTFFEYRLKRKPPEKIDFLRYIEYETNLEKLRKKRRKKQGRVHHFQHLR